MRQAMQLVPNTNFFDPAGFCKDEASFKDLRAKELKHGRIWVLDGESFLDLPDVLLPPGLVS